jgi:ABC-2 type transport system permease protein
MMFWHVARRDLFAAFSTPLAWLVIACWSLLTNFVFIFFSVQPIRESAFGSEFPLYVTTLHMGVYFLLLLSPALSMNSFAAEQGQGTMQLLMTAPIREIDLVLGKFTATFLLLATLIFVTLSQVAVLSIISAVQLPHLIAGYLGILLAAALFASLGVWISLIVDSPVAAYVITFAVIAVLLLVGAGEEGTLLGSIGKAVGILERTSNFFAGRIRLGDVTYFVGASVALLICSHAALSARRIHG